MCETSYYKPGRVGNGVIRRTVAKAIVRYTKAGHPFLVNVLQGRPYTAVRIGVKIPPNGPTTAIVSDGFSKVMWPDEWCPEKGVKKAIGQAVGRAVRPTIQERGETRAELIAFLQSIPGNEDKTFEDLPVFDESA